MAVFRCCLDMTLLLIGRVAYRLHMNLFPKFNLFLSKNPVKFSGLCLGSGGWENK
jgi:hypothetical protein